MTDYVMLKLFVGTNAGQTSESTEAFTVGSIVDLAEKLFADFTVVSCEGFYNGSQEPSAQVLVRHEVDPVEVLPTVKFLGDAQTLVTRYHEEMGQKEVICELTFVRAGCPMTWTRVSKHDKYTNLVPLPEFAAMRLCPSQDWKKAALYEGLETSLKRWLKEMKSRRSRTLPGIPSIVTMPSKPASIEFVIQEKAEGKNGKLEKWDEGIVEDDGNGNGHYGHLDEEHEASIAFLRYFQKASDERCFYATNGLTALVSDAKLKLRKIPFCKGAVDSERYRSRLLTRWVDAGKVERLKDDWIVKHPLVGFEALVLGPDTDGPLTGRVMCHSRSSTVSGHQGDLALAPSGTLEPIRGVEHVSLYWSFLKELDEELFNGEDSLTKWELEKKPHIKELEGRLTYLGRCFSLTSQYFTLLLLFQPCPKWWNYYEGRIRMNWEYERQQEDPVTLKEALEELNKGSTAFTPSTAVTLRLAEEALKGRRNGRGER